MTKITWQKIKEFALNIFFPHICLTCRQVLDNDAVDILICDKCTSLIPINDTLFCGQCKARLPENQKICHKETPARLAAATSYDKPVIKKLIWQFKYQKNMLASRPLVDILLRYLSDLDFDFSDYIIIPIPLHPSRKKYRGFNQAEILGREIASKLHLDIYLDTLLKIKNSKSQAEMKTREERIANISGCFDVNKICIKNIANKKIIVIDDVFTSGATSLEAARVLKSFGAKNILILTITKGN